MDEPPYERIFFTGRRRLRDASLMLTGRAGDAYGITGGAYTGRAFTGRPSLRGTEAEALAGLASLYTSAYGTSPITACGGGGLRDGGAYGTSLLTGRPPYGPEALTGRASLRTEALTGRASLRDEPPCAEALTDEPPYERRRFFTGRRRLRRRKRLRDER